MCNRRKRRIMRGRKIRARRRKTEVQREREREKRTGGGSNKQPGGAVGW
jgi:hypothetical protein